MTRPSGPFSPAAAERICRVLGDVVTGSEIRCCGLRCRRSWRRHCQMATWADSAADRGLRQVVPYRRRVGSRSAWCRASASALTRAYLASDLTEV